MAAAENVRNARVTGATANVAVALSASRLTVTSALVVALDGNTDKVAVGGIDALDATVGGQSGVLLAPGDSVPFGAVDLADLHMTPRIAGQGVAIVWTA